MHIWCRWGWLLLALPCLAAERKFDFGEFHEGQTPPGFRSTVTGKGKPGEWKVILEDVPPLMPPLGSQAPPPVTKHAVLAQLAMDPTDEHFPLLVYDTEDFGDFSLTTRFKTVRGVIEQMAGIAFRIQNESNYYVVRASSLGSTLRFYRVIDGQRGSMVTSEIPIPSGVWHELAIDCKGNKIRCRVDDKDLPPITETSLGRGKIGFWTKSDSVTYFSDTKIVYAPRGVEAQKIVKDILHKYPRLLGLKIYVPGNEAGQTRLIASGDEKELGTPGAKTEQEVIGHGDTYYGKENDSVSVIMPLRDRNGDAMAAVRVVMKSFPGQTEENAIIRAAPIVKEIQARAGSLDDLLD